MQPIVRPRETEGGMAVCELFRMRNSFVRRRKCPMTKPPNVSTDWTLVMDGRFDECAWPAKPA